MGSQDQQDTGVYREGDATIIRVAQEQAFVSKHTAETSRVRINLTKETRSETLRADLRCETVEVRRVPVDREIQSAPPIREEGGVTIIPVVEERLVTMKKLFLTEELHVSRVLSVTETSHVVDVRIMHADIERLAPAPKDQTP